MIELLLDNHVFTLAVAVTAGIMAHCGVPPDIIGFVACLGIGVIAGLTWWVK